MTAPEFAQFGTYSRCLRDDLVTQRDLSVWFHTISVKTEYCRLRGWTTP